MPGFDASIVQTWKNKCKRGSVLDYETLKCVSASSARGKELMSAERRAKAVLASGKTTRQKLFGVLKIAGQVTSGYLLGYLLTYSPAVSMKFARLLGRAAKAAGVSIRAYAGKTPPPEPIVVAAKDTTKTLLKKTMRALAAVGAAGAVLAKLGRGRGGGPAPAFAATLTPAAATLGRAKLEAYKQKKAAMLAGMTPNQQAAQRHIWQRHAERGRAKLQAYKRKKAATPGATPGAATPTPGYLAQGRYLPARYTTSTPAGSTPR